MKMILQNEYVQAFLALIPVALCLWVSLETPKTNPKKPHRKNP
jgi:hypothetical protein